MMRSSPKPRPMEMAGDSAVRQFRSRRHCTTTSHSAAPTTNGRKVGRVIVASPEAIPVNSRPMVRGCC